MVENVPRKRILVVDDEQLVTDYFKTILESNGYEVDVAYNGKEAYRMVNRKHYDLVHMDIRMPDWDGLDSIAAMGLTNPNVKIFVVSGVLTDDVIKELENEDNVKGWVEKPVGGENYLRIVKSLL